MRRKSWQGPPPPQSVPELEELLSRPDDQVCQALSHLDGNLVILGAGGKMGPTLARMAHRALQQAGAPGQVIAVSRFRQEHTRQALEQAGIQTIRADLLDPEAIARLPDARMAIGMTAMKFGASQDPPQTWATHVFSPPLLLRHYRNARFALFSTGNVYPMVRPESGGSRETDPPDPRGEYAMSALGRERVCQYWSRQLDIPLTILRLNYAVELRYGVLVDLAQAIRHGHPIHLQMAYVNVIWQRDASAMALRALLHGKPGGHIINIAGPEIVRVRQVAETLGELLGRRPVLEGREEETAFLSNGTYGYRLLGRPQMDLQTVIHWTADWIAHGRPTLGKPTLFHVRDGQF